MSGILSAVLALALLGRGTQGVQAQGKQLVFVENSRGGDVAVMDDATLRVVGTIPVGLSPDDIVPTRDGTTLYLSRIVRREGGEPAAPGQPLGEVVAIDPAAQRVLWRAPLTGVPNHLIVSPDDKYVYVTIVSHNRVDVVDIAQRKVVDSIPVGTGPHDIEISEDGKRGYVGLIHGAAVNEFDATTRKMTRNFPMPQDVRPIQVTRDESTMYLQLSYTYGFTVLDLKSGKIARSVTMPVPPGATKPDSMPNTTNHGLRLAMSEKVLIANGSMYDLVGFYALPSLELLGTVPVGRDPNWVTLTPDGKHAYVSNRGSDDVSVIDIATRKELARIKTGKYPQRMASVTVSR